MRMRRVFVFIVWLFVFVACNDEASQIGSGFFQDGDLEVVYIDSITAKVSTIYYDSIYTSDATRFLVGYHQDVDMGKLFASALFQIAPAAALSLDPELTAYSKTVLHLNLDGYSQYDTTHQITLKVHEITQDIEAREDGYLYNISKFKYKDEALGSLTLVPRPHINDSLEIPLDDVFGRNIFSLAQNEAEEVSSPAAFVEAFKGIIIRADSSQSGPILGFGITPEIRIYYWDKTTAPAEEKSIVINGGQYFKFNQVLSDHRNSSLSSLVGAPEEELDSRKTNNVAYLQGGTGLLMRVEFPYLRQVMIQNPDLTITDAEIEFYPIRDPGGWKTTLPDLLLTAQVDYRNNAISATTLSPVLVRDYYLDRDTHYSLDVRSFITTQLSTESTNRNALLFTFSANENRHSVDLLKIGNQKSERKMVLKLYCVVIKN